MNLHGDMPEVPGLLISRAILPLSELSGVLARIARGALDIEGACVKFLPTGERQGRRPFYASMDVRPAETSHPDVDHPFNTGFFLSLTGDSVEEVLSELGGPERVDRLLRVAANPYKDVSTFLHNALRAQGGTASGQSRIFSAWAPIGVVIDRPECRLSAGDLSVTLKASNGVARRLTSIGWSGLDKMGRSVSGSVPVGHRRWSRAAYGWRYQLTVPARNMKTTTVLLRVGDETFAMHDLNVQTGLLHPLLAARSVQGEGNQLWTRLLLDTKGSQQTEFEEAVARLLAMLGLPVDPLYRKKNGASLDATAWIPGGSVLACECTTGTLKGDGKLAKLVARTAELRMDLAKAGISVHRGRVLPQGLGSRALTRDQIIVLPVMFVSWPREQVSDAEVEEAGRDGVAVLAREDIAHLLRLAEETASLSQVEVLVRSRIYRPAR